MPYVIAEPCIGNKDGSCQAVCPVDCIQPLPEDPDFATVEQLYIDPTECIDCNACVDACPVNAPFDVERLPERWAAFAAVNSDFFANRG